MRKIITLLIFMIFLVSSVSADITPQDDTDYKNVYKLYNVNNISVWTNGDVCIDNGNCLSKAKTTPNWLIDNNYLYNDSTTVYFNETLLNSTSNNIITDLSLNWDKNVSDDFNSSWNSLTDIPSGFADGIDDNTALNLGNIRIVSTDINAEFNLIQDAIDNITDASINNPYVILISPGVYNQRITMKPYISLRGNAAWGRDVHIINNTMPVIDWTDTTSNSISNIYVSSNITTDQTECIIKVQNGAKQLFDTVINFDSTNGNGCLISTENVLPFVTNRVGAFFNLYGNPTGQQDINLIQINNLTLLKMQSWVSQYVTQSPDENINLFKIDSITAYTIANSDFDIEIESPGYSGTINTISDDSILIPNQHKHITGNTMHIDGFDGNGTCQSFGLENSFSSLTSYSNHYFIDNCNINRFANIGSNSFLASHFDDVTAVNEINGSPSNYDIESSLTPGVLTISKKIKLGQDVDTSQDLIEILIGEIPNPLFKYDNSWNGYSALLWDYQLGESVFGVEAQDDIARIIAQTSGNDAHLSNQGFILRSDNGTTSYSWSIVKSGSSNQSLIFAPDQVSSNSPLTLSKYSPFTITLDKGESVDEIVNYLNSSVTGLQLVTADAIKNYIDTKTANVSVNTTIIGNETAFNGWDKNESNDFDSSWNSLTNIPAGFVDNVDNDTQLTESQVDAYADNNNYVDFDTYPNVDTDGSNDLTSIGVTSPLATTGGTTPTLSISNNGIGNTLLQYDTGQDLTTTSSVSFNNVTIANGECMAGASGGYICFNATHTIIG